ncbi:MAG: iron-siderophore ABC transporter substrate-binding protein [Acidimicrobiales bacterium]
MIWRVARYPLLLLAAALIAASCGSTDAVDETAAPAVSTTEAASASPDADHSESPITEASDDATTAGEAGSSFPITIEHVYGETVIEAAPKRVATVAWANHEVPLALGVVPVGMAKATWGDDDGDGIMPWVEARLDELGAETPVLFDETDGIDFEAVANTGPDVILASYSGLTQEDFDTLSQIAPTIPYPEVAWGTSVHDMIAINAEAMGMADEGAALIAELEAIVAEAFSGHAELEGKKVVFSYIDPADTSQIGFYTTHDTRPGFLMELGIQTPDVVAERSAGTEAFYDTISAEQADLFADADVFVAYGDESTLAALQADPLIGSIPAIANGAVAVLENSTPLAASANPSPLSIPWNIDDYFSLLAAAAANAG